MPRSCLWMSTKSRRSIYGGPITGAKIRAEGARKRAAEAIREADRAEAEAWSIQMEGYGGPAQPSPTIGQCLHGGYGWLEGECHHCKTRASIPLDAIRRPRNTPDLETCDGAEMPVMQGGEIRPSRSHHQAYPRAGDQAVCLGASG